MKSSYLLAVADYSGDVATKRTIFTAADAPVRIDLVTFYTAGTTAQNWVLGTEDSSGRDGIMAYASLPVENVHYAQFPPSEAISVTLMRADKLFARRLGGGTDAVTISVYGEPIKLERPDYGVMQERIEHARQTVEH